MSRRGTLLPASSLWQQGQRPRGPPAKINPGISTFPSSFPCFPESSGRIPGWSMGIPARMASLQLRHGTCCSSHSCLGEMTTAGQHVLTPAAKRISNKCFSLLARMPAVPRCRGRTGQYFWGGREMRKGGVFFLFLPPFWWCPCLSC